MIPNCQKGMTCPFCEHMLKYENTAVPIHPSINLQYNFNKITSATHLQNSRQGKKGTRRQLPYNSWLLGFFLLKCFVHNPQLQGASLLWLSLQWFSWSYDWFICSRRYVLLVQSLVATSPTWAILAYVPDSAYRHLDLCLKCRPKPAMIVKSACSKYISTQTRVSKCLNKHTNKQTKCF